MKPQILAITAIAAMAAFPAFAEAPRSVPIHTSDMGHILAEATVDGKGPYTFVLDTAASPGLGGPVKRPAIIAET